MKRGPGERHQTKTDHHPSCEKCDGFLHEEKFIVRDYAEDPVSKAYQRFFDSEKYRTCKKCGEIMPAPESL